jgi:MOSC domain-containing protein YiiM/SAM-dependent methyltransferase
VEGFSGWWRYRGGVIDHVHPLAAQFDAAADAYERGRPGYPPEAVEATASFLDLRAGRSVLDLAAGTGKMTRSLVPSGARVVAVEPVAGMRARLEGLGLDVEVLDGTAEAIPLANGSIEGAVVAQAFHWFDAVRALSELHRVLVPDGRLVLAWNRRDESVPWVRALGELIETTTGGEAPSTHHGWQDRLARNALFEAIDPVVLTHVHRQPRASMVDRLTSISTVAALPPEAQAELAAEFEALLDRDPDTAGRDVIDFPYVTTVDRLVRRSPVLGRAGIVVSVNLNRGGVPKPPVDGTRILRLGLEGDGHHDTAHHGGVIGAVCLYPQEAIERVRADGHQSFPGSYGENLTTLGLDWTVLQEGDRLAIGSEDDGPVLELTKYATPCQTQAHWFTEARISRISHLVHPQDARWYARVRREGEVRPGMPIRVLDRD